jgi:hypothetical protein
MIITGSHTFPTLAMNTRAKQQKRKQECKSCFYHGKIDLEIKKTGPKPVLGFIVCWQK